MAQIKSAYNDDTFRITRYTSGLALRFVNPYADMLNTECASFMMYRRGVVTGYDVDGNLLDTRVAGSTTDSFECAVPAELVIDASDDAEFYCAEKTSGDLVMRKTLDIACDTVVTGMSGLLCLLEGELSINDAPVFAPNFVRITDTDSIESSNKIAWAILIN